MALPQVQRQSPTLGCDPEFFFKVNNRVVGAETFIPKKGLQGYRDESKFIIDGVQAELNPRPNTCRAYLANEIRACFSILKDNLDKSGKKVEVDFSQSVTISKTELAKLDKKNQKFGCGESHSAHNSTLGVKLAKVDPLEHRQRSAGGHIHIGAGKSSSLGLAIARDADRVAQIFDIICGNTCVLVDRDKGNIERRKLYGGAGEYRLPKHGFEYRTLSNFWLQAYPLMSMTFGLARLASEVASSAHSERYYKALTKAAPLKDIEKAINKNDFALAYKNFKAIEPLLLEIMGNQQGSTHYAIDHGNIKEFHYFVQKVEEKGLEHFFDKDSLKHWINLPDAHGGGFNDTLRLRIRRERQKELNAAQKLLEEAGLIVSKALKKII